MEHNMEVRAAAEAIRGHRVALADAWRGRAPGLSASHANAVLGALAFALESGEEHGRGVFLALLDHDPGLQPTVSQLGGLRTTLQRHLLFTFPAEEALPSFEVVNRLIDGLVVVVTDRQMEELALAALLDPLTGVGNRRAFERDAPRELAIAKRNESDFSVITLDLDGLKAINDSEGHAAGDEALRRLAHGLGKHMRESDAVYRVGGDEFVVLLPGTGPAGAAVFLDRSSGEGPSFGYGVASAPADGWSVEDLLLVADGRLLATKRNRPDGEARVRGGGGGGVGETGVLGSALAMSLPGQLERIAVGAAPTLAKLAIPILAVVGVLLLPSDGVTPNVTPPAVTQPPPEVRRATQPRVASGATEPGVATGAIVAPATRVPRPVARPLVLSGSTVAPTLRRRSDVVSSPTPLVLPEASPPVVPTNGGTDSGTVLPVSPIVAKPIVATPMVATPIVASRPATPIVATRPATSKLPAISEPSKLPAISEPSELTTTSKKAKKAKKATTSARPGASAAPETRGAPEAPPKGGTGGDADQLGQTEGRHHDPVRDERHGQGGGRHARG